MEAIRAVEDKANRPIGVLMDLQGPKLRIGTFDHGPVMLKPGASLRLDRRSGAGQRKAREPSASRDLRRDDAGPAASARRREAAPRGRALRRRLRGDARGSRRQAFRSQGRQHPRRHHSAVAAHREGSPRPRIRARSRRRLGGALFRPASRGHRRGARADRRPRGNHGQARKADGDQRGSTRSSTRPTGSWSRAAISASRCGPSRCRRCSGGSSAPAAARASR